MADGDIQGTVTDADGNPISGLTIYLINEDNPSQVKTTTTDANGNYLFDDHPDAQTNTDNYHVVAGAYDDGTDLFNTFSKPQVTADLRAPFFDVSIAGTNAPVSEGNDLNVDYSVQNTGGNGTQDITLEIDSTQEDIDSGVTISGGDSTTGTLTWPTADGEAGDYTATVLSDDDNASTSVTIENAIPDSEGFEHNDLTGVYGGETGAFSIQTSTVSAGTYALKAEDNNNTLANIVRDAEPWERDGLEISYDFYIESGAQGSFIVSTDVTGFDSFNGYAFYTDPGSSSGKARLRRYDDGSLATQEESTDDVTTGGWITPTVTFDGGDVTWDIDGASLTLSDTTYTDLLIGFQAYAGSLYYDEIRFAEI